MGIFNIEKKDQCSICGEFYVACYKLKDKSKICKNCIKKIGGYWTSSWVNMTRDEAIKTIEGNKEIVCPMCNKVEIKKHDNVCENCKSYMISNAQYLQEAINRFSNDIEKGYKHIDPYLSRYKLILEQYKTAYEYAKYLPEIFKLDPPTYEETFNKYLIKIDNTISKMKKVIIHKLQMTGESSYLKELKKIRDEILEAQINYPEFAKVLTIDDIQEVLK